MITVAIVIASVILILGIIVVADRYAKARDAAAARLEAAKDWLRWINPLEFASNKDEMVARMALSIPNFSLMIKAGKNPCCRFASYRRQGPEITAMAIPVLGEFKPGLIPVLTESGELGIISPDSFIDLLPITDDSPYSAKEIIAGILRLWKQDTAGARQIISEDDEAFEELIKQSEAAASIATQ